MLEFKRIPNSSACGTSRRTSRTTISSCADDVLRGLKVLEKHAVPFDLLFYAKHLRHAPTLARQLPELPMVIDHLAKPQIKERQFDDWLPTFAPRQPSRIFTASSRA